MGLGLTPKCFSPQRSVELDPALYVCPTQESYETLPKANAHVLCAQHGMFPDSSLSSVKAVVHSYLKQV